eukprot:scaffold10166_cov146-Isochrysis_galbana.AAC.4
MATHDRGSSPADAPVLGSRTSRKACAHPCAEGPHVVGSRLVAVEIRSATPAALVLRAPSPPHGPEKH